MIKLPFTKSNRVSVFEMLSGLDWSLVKTALDSWKDGQKGYLWFTKESKPKSQQQLGYYYGVILPHAVQAFKDAEDWSLTIEGKGRSVEIELNLENMDLFLKSRYGKMDVFKDKREMSMAECAAYEDFCIKWLAKWMNCQVPPADTNFKKGGD